MNTIIFGARHGQILLLFLTYIFSYCLRQNLYIAIVSMTDASTQSGTFQVFEWTSGQRGVLLAALFYGYIVSNLPAGILANRFSMRYLLSACSLSSGISTILFPVIAAQTGLIGCCISRAVLGFFQGLIIPCTSAHIAVWSAPEEKASFIAIAYCGIPLGTAAVTMLGGYLSDSSGGWPSVFYSTGSVGILWGLVLFWFLRDSPWNDKNISVDERIFLGKNLDTSENLHSLPIPWRKILMSRPLWTAVFSGFCHYWGVWSLATMLPSYMKAIFNVDMKQNGVNSAIPYFGMFASGIVGPIMEKAASKRFNLPLTTSRKIWNSLGEYSVAVCFAIIGLAQPGATAVVVILVIAEFCAAFAHMGFACSAVDLAPNFAGVVMGITNGLGVLSSVSAPTIIGFMLDGEGTPFQWSVVFVLAAGIMTLGGTVYNLMGSAEVQPWNSPDYGNSSA